MYATIRIKRGDARYLKAMSRHGDSVLRARMKNVDPDRTPFNRFLVGSSSMENDVKEFHANTNPKRRKGDDTQYAHVLLLASPEYFQNDDNSQKLDHWVQSSISWAKEEFGKGLVHARLDLDESTPHIDLAIVPTYTKTTKRGKKTEWLSFRQQFGIPSDPKRKFSYEEWQDKYANSIAHLGLKRGEPGSKTQHISPAAFRSKKIAQDLAETEAKVAFENRILLAAGRDNHQRQTLIFSRNSPAAEITRLTSIFTPVWSHIWQRVKTWSSDRRTLLKRLRDNAHETAAARIGADTLLVRGENEAQGGIQALPNLSDKQSTRTKGIER